MTTARVLHVYKRFRPDFTGEGIFLERLAPIFSALRPDVEHDVAVTITEPPPETTRLRSLSKLYFLARDGKGTSQARLFFWLMRNAHRYDTIHYHSLVDRTFAASLLLAFLGCRQVLSATLDDSLEGILKTYRPAYRPFVRILINALDRFVAISMKLYHENSRYISARKAALVPIGIDIPALEAHHRAKARARLGLPANIPILISIGGICRRKNQLFLVEQLPELLQTAPDLMLILVGPPLEPDYIAEIERVIRSRGLQAYIRMPGYSEAPWEFYRAADVMVFASRDEGFGTVMIEAMAYALPVVARHLPGVNDTFIQHGHSGFLFKDAEQYRSIVRELLQMPQRCAEVGQAARTNVQEAFDITKIAKRYLDIYGYPAPERAA
jgi:glycosyltransferase involved in cell wall biosynthesis